MNENSTTKRTKNSSSAPQLVTLQIAELHRDRRHQMRNGLDAGIAQRYTLAYSSGQTLPPIRVAVVDGVPCVVDGWHRLEALERNGATTVDAEVHQDVAPEDALWMAAEANLRHGLPLKPKELRRAFVAYVRAGKQRQGRSRFRSYREIAADLGGLVAYSTVRRWMEQDFPDVYKALGGPSNGAPGGLQEVRMKFAQQTRAALDEALATYRGISDPQTRGQLIAHTRKLLETMEAAGPWKLPPVEPEGSDF